MTERKALDSGARSAGYDALIEREGLRVVPNWHRSRVGLGSLHRIERIDMVVEEFYPARYWPGDSIGAQLEFALKYDGVNLEILASLFSAVDGREIQQYVESTPTGKYARRVWFLYEFLTGERLPIDDLKQGNYIDVLDADAYFVSTTLRRVRRHRVRDNLLGGRRFCPVIRRTEALTRFEQADLGERCRGVIAGYSDALLRRALSYLYTKETKSSFEIEHAKPNSSRLERFTALLRLAEREDFCTKPALVGLQNRIVDARFRADDYRSFQNYVGESVSLGRERVHYACPRPEDIHDLMGGLVEAHERMSGGLDFAIAHAAAVSYGFVYMHPFEDGNGRIHRFLIHNVLSRRGLTPPGLMFPVSAAILKDRAAYDASLEAFSRPLMNLVEYTIDSNGNMHVESDVASAYRYVDLTAQAEALCCFVQEAIETDLVEELAFIRSYDQTKHAIQAVVDMPDRKIDLFIRFCLQNNGRLSTRKRDSHFPDLTDDEIRGLEEAVSLGYRDRA